MNERIRELESTARSWAKDEIAYLERVHNRDYTFDEASDEFNKKFAELIIKECIALCQEKVDEFDEFAAAGDDEFVGRSIGAYQCIEVIGDTFGVEE